MDNMNQEFNQNIEYSNSTYPKLETPKKKNSELGIISLVLVLCICPAWLGFILAIIDLCINKENKHECSIVAMILCVAPWVISFVWSFFCSLLLCL